MNLGDAQGVIRLDGIRKSHRGEEILHGVGFTARSGQVTAFLGPNGAGKSSTLRILLGLDRADSGSATFDGLTYDQLERPLTYVGTLLDGLGGGKYRRVRTYLSIIAESNGIPLGRVGETLDQVGMSTKASARLGTLSLGEAQRVGLAAALLGDPQFLVMDEPTNGLDPAGIKWFRHFLAAQAREGKTILLSSHILSEVQGVANQVVLIARGNIVLEESMGDVLQQMSTLEDVFFELTGTEA